MTLKTIIEVCELRHRYEKSCRGCRFYGKTCEHAKKVLKVNEPFEYNPINTNKEEKK